MNQKYFKGYRVPSARRAHWDYRSAGAYYVTICTKRRVPFFGHIDGNPLIPATKKMNLTPIGEIAQTCWMQIPDHFDHVRLGEFVIMPDHMHGIVIINDGDDWLTDLLTISDFPLIMDNPNPNANWKPGNLGVIINQYKRACTIMARRMVPEFGWQPRFHDRVIRNENDYRWIAGYINDNVRKAKL